MQGQESVPSVLESDARGEIADIYADIRKVLGTSVVNLIWRNLATMPGALQWTWSTVRPLYLGDAPLHAEAVRRTIALPDWPGFSADTLLAAGVGRDRTGAHSQRAGQLSIHQRARAGRAVGAAGALRTAAGRCRDSLPTPRQSHPAPKFRSCRRWMRSIPKSRRWSSELNAFGEDTEPQLIASMYRHLAYWPAYLALVRTMLAPLQRQGRLECADAFDPRARACPWRDAGAATETVGAAGHAARRARIVPPVRRTSDRAHDRALRADPARDAGVNQLSEHFGSDLSQNDLIAVKGTASRSRFP